MAEGTTATAPGDVRLDVPPPVVNPDAPLEERLRVVLHYFVNVMSETLQERSREVQDNPEFAAELTSAAKRYRDQAHAAVEIIRDGELTLPDLRHVAGTLYLTNLTIRWVLEQQTEEFRKLMNSPSPDLARQIVLARERVEAGEVEAGFQDLLKLVEANRGHYPLLMIMGFIYLKYKKNLSYAMRYFEKAAHTSTPLEPEHYRGLALSFLASCHESKKRYKNALNTLLLAARGKDVDPSLLYDIARMYGCLGEEAKAQEYFNRAVRKRPEFFAMALVDQAFLPVREPIEKTAKEHNEIFRRIGRLFLELITPLIEPVEKYSLERDSKDLEREMRIARINIAMAREGCYSGYRVGVVGFFKGVFPEILDLVRRTLIRRGVRTRERIREHNRKVKRRFGILQAVFLPVAALAAGYGAYLAAPRLLPLLPLELPRGELLLAVLAGLVGVGLTALVLSVLRDRMVKSEGVIAEIRRAAEEVERLEPRLARFWREEVAPNVDDAPIWDDEVGDLEAE